MEGGGVLKCGCCLTGQSSGHKKGKSKERGSNASLILWLKKKRVQRAKKLRAHLIKMPAPEGKKRDGRLKGKKKNPRGIVIPVK